MNVFVWYPLVRKEGFSPIEILRREGFNPVTAESFDGALRLIRTSDVAYIQTTVELEDLKNGQPDCIRLMQEANIAGVPVVISVPYNPTPNGAEKIRHLDGLNWGYVFTETKFQFASFEQWGVPCIRAKATERILALT